MNTDFKHTNQIVDFALPPVRGGPGRLSQHLVNKQGAVIVFWSGVCSHCVRYDAYLNDFENRNPGIALLVVAANTNPGRNFWPHSRNEPCSYRCCTTPIVPSLINGSSARLPPHF